MKLVKFSKFCCLSGCGTLTDEMSLYILYNEAYIKPIT